MIFTVVVPTFRRPDLLARCLRALAAQSTQDFITIVSDDAHAAEIATLLARDFPWARYVRGPQKGPAANRNFGARQTDTPWLAFLDDDCIAEPAWLAAFIAHQQDGPLLEGRTHANGPRRSLAHIAPINEHGGLLWSCNFAVERTLFDSLDGFNERFKYAAMEDVDFRVRAEKLGVRARFVPEARVCHPWRQKGGWAQRRQHMEATELFLREHPDARAQLNSRYFVHQIWNGLRRELIGEFPAHHGAGITQLARDLAYAATMAARTLLRSIK